MRVKKKKIGGNKKIEKSIELCRYINYVKF